MSRLLFLFLGAVFLFSGPVNAQSFAFYRTDSVPVLHGTDTLNYAWAGGFSYNQYSRIDMDMDGDMDVVTGEMEKSADPDQIIVFLNDGDGLRWKKHIVKNCGIYSGKIADVGNDGDMDIIANRNFDSAPLELWENLIINKSSVEEREKN